MRRFQEPTFSRAEVDEILGIASEFKDAQASFVQLCATTTDEGCDILYSFRKKGAKSLTGVNVAVASGQHVPSISELYPEAFVFENEAHDLFGIDFDGIVIDYGGQFYTVAVAYPMNPRAAVSGDGAGAAAGDASAGDASAAGAAVADASGEGVA